jgi:hypothetical protein
MRKCFLKLSVTLHFVSSSILLFRIEYVNEYQTYLLVGPQVAKQQESTNHLLLKKKPWCLLLLGNQTPTEWNSQASQKDLNVSQRHPEERELPHPVPSMGMQLTKQSQIQCPLPDIDLFFVLQISIPPKLFPSCLSPGNSFAPCLYSPIHLLWIP